MYIGTLHIVVCLYTQGISYSRGGQGRCMNKDIDMYSLPGADPRSSYIRSKHTYIERKREETREIFSDREIEEEING